MGLREVRYRAVSHTGKTRPTPIATTRVNALSVPDAFVPANFQARLRSQLKSGVSVRVKTGADQSLTVIASLAGPVYKRAPTALMENTVIEQGVPDRSVLTTCAYCGVGYHSKPK